MYIVYSILFLHNLLRVVYILDLDQVLPTQGFCLINNNFMK